MDLVWYVYEGWKPRVRPASARRAWMDEAAESFPYRCLPLGVANSHGWEILSPCGFSAVWNGGLAPEDVTVTPDPGAKLDEVPVPLFGQGTFTLHVQGLIRTPPGWNLYVSGPPNEFKDGVMPLTGLIETDWSPYTFTMNWRLTRPGLEVRFEENEPIAHFFPVERGALERFQPTFAPVEAAPQLKAEFEAWSASRNAFQEEVRRNPPQRPADKWQKLYYRGATPSGQCPIADHRTKLQPRPFARADLGADVEARRAPAPPALPSLAPSPASPPPVAGAADGRQTWLTAKYEWLLGALARQRTFSNQGAAVALREGLTSDDFLEDFYAQSRPVVLDGELASWPARHWTAASLRETLRGRIVEFQGGRGAGGDFERHKDNYSRQVPFERFVDMIEGAAGNDAYLTAYNSRINAEALAPLQNDVRPLDKFLDQPEGRLGGMFWIGPAGTFTPLHHDLTNNLLVQVVGRKRVILADAVNLPRLYNDQHVFSEIRDLADPNLDLQRYARLLGMRAYDLTLEPGQALYIPVGWWHQVGSLDFSVSITYTNFRWPNDFHIGHPPG